MIARCSVGKLSLINKYCDLNGTFSDFQDLISHVTSNMVTIMLTSAFHQAADWAKSIFSLAELGDSRRTTRENSLN